MLRVFEAGLFESKIRIRLFTWGVSSYLLSHLISYECPISVDFVTIVSGLLPLANLLN